MSIVWRPRAEAEFRDAVNYLVERDEKAAMRLRDAVVEAVQLLERRPLIGRVSRYPGYRVWSLPRWKKLIVFRELANDIEIAALLDTRQDTPTSVE